MNELYLLMGIFNKIYVMIANDNLPITMALENNFLNIRRWASCLIAWRIICGTYALEAERRKFILIFPFVP